MTPIRPEETEQIKSMLSTNEALSIICFSKHHLEGRINCTKLSELLKIPINKIKDVCTKLEEKEVIKMYKSGLDVEIEFLEKEDADIKKILDEVIWDNREEYGKIYKKLVTAELMDFMKD
ncbi:MAG: hypothetical protein KA120_09350 [Candidatus Goldbacteria bacterium]|nr:hypothetical protein [Candidatus Goldiibacteriota bacterium]